MRNEEEIRLLRNELDDWISMIFKMGPSFREPLVIASLLTIYDTLSWTLQALPRNASSGHTFDTIMGAFRTTFEEVKKKQHQQRNPLTN